MRNIKTYAVSGMIAFMAISLTLNVNGWTQTVKNGDLFPIFSFKQKMTVSEKEYLGLAKDEEFTIKDMTYDIFMIEFLNKFCSSCQKQAPVFNQLFQKIKSNPELKERVKVVGVGMGNTLYQLQKFREDRQITFPLIQDPDYVAHRAIGEPRTPFTVLLKKNEKGEPVLLYNHLGYMSSYDEILENIKGFLKEKEAKPVAAGEEKKDFNELEAPTKNISENNFFKKVRTDLNLNGYKVTTYKKIEFSGEKDRLYFSTIDSEAGNETMFLKEVYRTAVCDVCHDVHFWFIFDMKGKVRFFNPLYATKYGNREWDSYDIRKMKNYVLQQSLLGKKSGEGEIVVITSATMTSGLIVDAIKRSASLFNQLKEKGLIKPE